MPKGKTTKENTWQCIEYWIKRNPGLSTEECQKLLDEKLLHRKQSNPNNIEYWNNLYPNEDNSLRLLHYKKENNFQCIEYWIKRNPELSVEECRELLNTAKKVT